MKKKKFLALLLTGAMALAALTGCSSGTETTEESTVGMRPPRAETAPIRLPSSSSTRPTRSRSASPRAHRRRPMSWVWS